MKQDKVVVTMILMSALFALSVYAQQGDKPKEAPAVNAAALRRHEDPK